MVGWDLWGPLRSYEQFVGMGWGEDHKVCMLSQPSVCSWYLRGAHGGCVINSDNQSQEISLEKWAVGCHVVFASGFLNPMEITEQVMEIKVPMQGMSAQSG